MRARTLPGMLLLVVILGSLGGATPTMACTVCYGEAQGPMIDGARMGVWLLFGLTACMQLAFVGFFIYLHRRLKATPDRVVVRDRMHLIKGAK